MKKDIHPKYYPEAEVICDCGAKFTIGSTLKKIHTEICYQCNPVYTGEKKIIDTAGRVEKFNARIKKAEQLGQNRRKTKKAQKAKPSKSH